MTTSTTTRKFVSLHALHAFPASLLNRDETGSTKNITYGGIPRVRVSSQAFKRPMRVHMREAGIADGAFSIRTSRLPHLVAEALASGHGRDPDVASAKTAMVCTAVGLKANEKTGNTSNMVFLPAEGVDRIAEVVHAHWDQINGSVPAEVTGQVRVALDVAGATDLALFGRMLTGVDDAKVDGAVKVAHAFSVDPARVNVDFFTAVEDVPGPDSAASSHLGVQDLSAPVLYRHAAVDQAQLRANLSAADDPDALAVEGVRAVVESFVQAVPSAKQNSTGASTLPAFLIGVASNRETSFADAFTAAINSDDVLGDATRILFGHATRTVRFMPDAKVVVLPVTVDPASLPVVEGFTVVDGVDEFLAELA